MQKLVKYLQTHKSYMFKCINNKYLTQEVSNVLNKYNLTLQELCYRIKHDISLDKIFKCKNCGTIIQFNKDHGYKNFCSFRCSTTYHRQQESVNIKIKQTCLRKYGVDSYSKTKDYQMKKRQTCLKKYGVDSYSKTQNWKNFWSENKDVIIQKRNETCLKKYGADNYSKTQECKFNRTLHLNEINNRRRQTYLNNYGVDNPAKVKDVQDKMKQTCLEKYGVSSYMQAQEFKEFIKEHKQEIQNKVYNTKKQNNSFNKSKFEEKAYNLLLTKFTKEDIERQYKSDKYPFACDFYIKSKDLYIECNGHWSHGRMSFNKENLEHQKILNKWQEKAKKSKFFQNAIYTWTDLDVRKLETFKKNKLNYKIFWNLEEVEDWIRSI